MDMNNNYRIRVGYWDRTCRETLWYPHDAHLMLTAPSGGGKFTNTLGPLGMCWQGSTVWIDPKLQAAAVLGRHLVQNLKHRVLVLNPFDILRGHLHLGLTPAKVNPMADLDPSLSSFGVDCESLADGIVYEETRGADGSHWTLSAKDLYAGVIGSLAKHGQPEEKNFSVMRRVICGDVLGFCRAAMTTDCEFIRQKLGRFAMAAPDNKEILGIVSTAITQGSFIGNAAIADNLSASSFSFRDLKKRRTTVFLGLPARYLSTCGKWFRLIVASAMNQLLHEERGVPVLMVLDEFAQLGRLKVIENAMGLARGYGVQLLPVLQDLNQLKGLYGESYQTFLANAGCRIFFSPQDPFTSDFLSAYCGETEVRSISKNINEDANGKVKPGLSYSSQKRSYLLAQEVRELPGDEMLVFGTGIPGVIRAGRRPYFASPEFKGMYDPDPYYMPRGNSGGRKHSGGFLGWLFE
jgi:type IV secretion system protein VirD4